MKRSSKELKRIARDILNNRYNTPMGAFVTASFITAVIEIPFSLSLSEHPATSQIVITLIAEYLIALISLVLGAGVTLVHLNMTRNKEFKISNIFEPFKQSTDRFFLVAFLLSLFAIVCCAPMIAGGIFYDLQANTTIGLTVFVLTVILSIILAIVFILNYSFAFFFLLDNPQMKTISVFKESRLMMKHNKGRLFYILISFTGWTLPILCSFGLASLWISPYMSQTLVNFYLDCTGELNHIPVRNYSKESNSYTNFHL